MFCLHSGQDWGDDYALYISETRAITDGRLDGLYHDNKFMADNSETVSGPYLYPLGFPLLLAPVYGMFGLNFIVMKIYLLLFFSGSIMILYFLLKTVFPQNEILITATIWIMALNHNYLSFVNNLTSDIPFMFFCLLSLYVMVRSFSSQVWKGILVGCLCFFSFLIREAGIVLLPCLFILQIYRRYAKTGTKNFNLLTVLLPYLVFGAFYFLTALGLPAGNKNLFSLLGRISADSISSNILYYFHLAGQFFISDSSFLPGWVFIVAAGVSIFFLVAGLIYHYRINPGSRFLVIFILAILGVYIFWPFKGGFRFLFPVFPFLIFFLLSGVELSLSKLKIARAVIVIIFLLNLVWGIKQTVYSFRHSNNESNTSEMKTIYDFIKHNTTQDKVIAFFKPRALYLFTGRISVNIKQPLEGTNPDVQYALVRKEELKFPKQYKIMLETENFVLVDLQTR